MVKRGEVWLAVLDPTIGSEIQKTRPCLIVSPDELNGRLRTAIVCPLTTGNRDAPFRLPIRFRNKDGLVLTDQIRTIDRSRLVKRLGRAKEAECLAVLAILQEMFASPS